VEDTVIVRSHFVILLAVILFHCNLPTAPENGHSALVADSSVAAARGRAADPTGHRLSPPCSAPAPLHFAHPQDRGPGYLFAFREGTDAKLVTSELAATYDFAPLAIFTVNPGFAAVVSEQALAAMRCDNRVQFVEYNIIFHVAHS
jgi:hypothetical protein